MRVERLLGALLLVAACSTPPAAVPSSSLPSATPSATSERLDVIRFQPRHHFLAFVMDGERLVFSGGDPIVKSSSPEVYSADPRTGDEVLVTRASDGAASITSLASVGGSLVFVETWPAGPVIYRVRTRVGNTDTQLDELVVSDPTLQLRYRASLASPMVATDGTIAVWVSSRLTDEQPEYRLMTSRLDGSGRRTLQTGREWIGYPKVSADVAYFTQSLGDPGVWQVALGGNEPAALFAPGHSEPAADRGTVVTKFGGGSALGPGGITLWTSRSEHQELAPATAVASEPSINERYVVWWGPTDKVLAFDRRSGKQVVLGEALRDKDGKRGIVGRQVAFPGVVVWLASPPGDLTVATANEKPSFQILFHRQ